MQSHSRAVGPITAMAVAAVLSSMGGGLEAMTEEEVAEHKAVIAAERAAAEAVRAQRQAIADAYVETRQNRRRRERKEAKRRVSCVKKRDVR